MAAHALLSASSSDRWLACPPSARLNEHIVDAGSVFAAEGTKAHELGERALVSGRHAHEIEGDYPHDMRDYVQMYIDHVRAIPGTLKVEQRLAFDAWVPEGFGTCDAVILDDGIVTICDLKYGKGLRVDAQDNAQLKLYALAALNASDAIWGPFHTVRMGIHQPRLDHVDEYEMKADDLYAWAETVLKPAAQLAWEGKGDLTPGEWCQFCKTRDTCRARADDALKTIGDMTKGPSLTNEELAAIYPKLDGIVRWANGLSDYCLTRAEAGTKFAGLKLVEGRSNRKIEDEDQARKRLEAAGFEAAEITNVKLKGLGDLEALIGKKEFAGLMGDLLIRPPGKPTLVAETDKRPAISDHTAAVSELLSHV